MRLLPISLLLGAATFALTGSAASAEDDEDDGPPENTIFNGKEVPPFLELTPVNWEKESKASRFLMVKHYSPYCGHCTDFAPTFQTLYEFYYTSSPAGKPDANFTEFYDFRFGAINCIAYNELCAAHNVQSWPTTTLYEKGEPIVIFKGKKALSALSAAVEDALEKVKPGTRPADLQLPEVGTATEKKPASDKTPAAQETKKPEPAAAAKPVESAPKYNLEGVSVPLTADTFQKWVTASEEPWFIKFYAPWCHHCQAMAPNWQQMAKAMEGKLNVGEVNCDAEPKLCKEAKLKGYPTILFFKGDERVEYEGLRGLGDFIKFAEKAVDLSSGVQDVDAESLKALEEKEDVIFIYFYDHATTSEDFLALERLPLNLIGRAKLVKTNDPKLYNRYKITTRPRLLVSREGRPTYYPPITPKEMRDTRQVLTWMKSVWLSIVPEMTASNAREIMEGKFVVLGLLNQDDPEAFQTAKREMKTAANEWLDKQTQLFQLERQALRDAKQLRIEEAKDRDNERALKDAQNMRIDMSQLNRKEVTFAWVDGAFWQRWIRTTYGIDVKEGDRVIINDEDNRRYWDVTSTGNPIIPSRTSIIETLNKVTENPPSIKPKLTISVPEKLFLDTKRTFTEHPFLTLGCIVGIVFAGYTWLKGRTGGSSRARGRFVRLEDAMGEKFKAPILGNLGGQTKSD